jgi:hypothetical protein
VEIDSIPDNQVLWRVICAKSQIEKNGKLNNSFFRTTRGFISCDLETFTKIELSLRGSRKCKSWPDGSGLIAFSVSDLRSLRSNAKHKPIKENEINFKNYAHAEIIPGLDQYQSKDLIRLCNNKFVVRPVREKLPNYIE